MLAAPEFTTAGRRARYAADIFDQTIEDEHVLRAVPKVVGIDRKTDVAPRDFQPWQCGNFLHSSSGQATARIVDADGLRGVPTGQPAEIKCLPVKPRLILPAAAVSFVKTQIPADARRDLRALKRWTIKWHSKAPGSHWDVRAFVLGDQVLAAMKRESNDWRTNVAQGATTSRLRLSASESQLAITAAKTVGCPSAGVDLLLGPNGWLVLEVNGVPGWKALSVACEIDVAGAVLDFIVEQVRT